MAISIHLRKEFSMSKKNLPGYLKHKPTGQAYCKIDGKFIYLGKYGSKASRSQYEELIAKYLANGKKLPPTKPQDDTTILSLASAFLEHAEKYYPPKNNRSSGEIWHYRKAISAVVKYYGKNPVDEFTPLALDFIRDKWVEASHARKTINRWTQIIKKMFQWGVTYGLVSTDVHYRLSMVPNLKMGHTVAPEYNEVQPVSSEIVEKTLPFLPPVVADMVRVQRLC